jgi:hypothetical protein
VRRRLRAAHPPERLAEIYARPHDHTRWADHVQRVERTIELARGVGPVTAAADLSCGSGAVLAAVDAERYLFGDYAPGYEYTGPLEQTLEQIPPVDLYVCTETLEHLDDPDAVLAQIRGKATVLLLSTPVENWTDPNVEHYWAWSRHDVDAMLAGAGWTPERYDELDFTGCGPWYYRFGMWVCR